MGSNVVLLILVHSQLQLVLKFIVNLPGIMNYESTCTTIYCKLFYKFIRSRISWITDLIYDIKPIARSLFLLLIKLRNKPEGRYQHRFKFCWLISKDLKFFDFVRVHFIVSGSVDKWSCNYETNKSCDTFYYKTRAYGTCTIISCIELLFVW